MDQEMEDLCKRPFARFYFNFTDALAGSYRLEYIKGPSNFWRQAQREYADFWQTDVSKLGSQYHSQTMFHFSEKIIPFPVIFEKLCRNFSMSKKNAGKYYSY